MALAITSILRQEDIFLQVLFGARVRYTINTMYHPHSPKRQLLARILVYSLMTLSVIVIVTISIFIILGYSYNRKDGRLEQGGLLQFASTPSGATVTLDGVTIGSRTPSKSSVDATNHFVTFSREGYRDWQKAITVQPGAIGWVSYARMIPKTITPESLHTFPALADSLASRDKKWLVVQTDASKPEMTLVDLSSSTPKYTTLTIPASALTEPETASHYDVVEWNADNNRFVVKRTYDTTHVEWLLIDRGDMSATTNLTAKAGLELTDVKISANDGREFLVKTADNMIRKLRVDSEAALSGPLAENVAEFAVAAESTLVYTTLPTETGEILTGYRRGNMDAAQTLYTFPVGTQGVHVALSSYFGVSYVTVTADQLMTVYRGVLPRDDTKSTLKKFADVRLPALATDVQVSYNGRFAIAGQPDGYTTYDIELAKTDTTTFTQPATVVRKQVWLDDFLAASDRAGTLRVAEFDGANQQDIMPIIEGQAMLLSSDDTYIYGFAKTDNGPSLVRARLILN